MHIRCLPEEVLLEIFKYHSRSLDWDGGHRTMDMARMAQKPLRDLAQVCTHFRRVVASNPSLWACIDCNANLLVSYTIQGRRTAELLATSLRLSGSTLLDVRLQNANESALLLFRDSVPQWKSAHIGPLGSPSDFEAFVQVCEGQLGNLTAAAYRRVSGGERPSTGRAATSRGCGSSYGDVHYRKPRQSYPGRVFEPTAVAHEHRASGDTCQEALRSWAACLRRITQFTFGVGNMYHEHSSRQALAVLDAVFRRLTLNLANLAFNKAPSSNGSKPQKFLWSHQTFLDFALRSELANTLRELSLVGAHISLPELRATLFVLDSLERLTIADDEANPTTLSSKLLFTSLQLPAVPRLYALTVHSALKFDGSALMDLVESRLRALGRFDYLQIHMPCSNIHIQVDEKVSDAFK
uniref:F-box domain-containing protein n=1 Tax=Mycena chlorophos TaxID=658473 RepID=A0ABQ0KV41_MYCCL|nr:predicted protein [Mycena chlorophos]